MAPRQKPAPEGLVPDQKVSDQEHPSSRFGDDVQPAMVGRFPRARKSDGRIWRASIGPLTCRQALVENEQVAHLADSVLDVPTAVPTPPLDLVLEPVTMGACWDWRWR
jgi:hypothetical protein